MTFRELGSVEDTAMEAANAKYSAVQRGYYKDDFIGFFVPNQQRQIPPMNLGYYVRMLSVYKSVVYFYNLFNKEIQVVILGCGYDTLFWRLRSININIKRWFEIDLAHVIKKKSEIIKNPVFQPLDNYFLLECDLGKKGELKTVLEKNGFENMPTVFVDECTLIYVEPDAVDDIILFSSSLSNYGFVSYSMVNPNDQFGRMMVNNFEKFGAPLKSISKYQTVESYRERFLSLGYKHVLAIDLNKTLKVVVPRSEYIKIIKLEIQDDPDELGYMLEHYVLTIAGSHPDFLKALS